MPPSRGPIRVPDRSVSNESRRWLFHLGAWGFTALAISWGLTLLLQSDTRVTNTGWRIALSVFGPDFWGWWMLVSGLIMLAAMLRKDRGRRLMLVGSLMVSFAVCGRAVAAALGAYVDSTVSWTGPQGWAALAAVYMAQGLIHAKAFRG